MSSENTVSKQSQKDTRVTSQQRGLGNSAHTGRGGAVSTLSAAGSRKAVGRGRKGQTSGHRLTTVGSCMKITSVESRIWCFTYCLCFQQQEAEPARATCSHVEDSEQMGADTYLTRLYGRAPYEGARRTLKKTPYLHFSSPGSPQSRKPRPRLVESVRGQSPPLI